MILDNSSFKVDLTLVNETPNCKNVWDDILELFHVIHNLISSPMRKKSKSRKYLPSIFLIPYAYLDTDISGIFFSQVNLGPGRWIKS